MYVYLFEIHYSANFSLNTDGAVLALFVIKSGCQILIKSWEELFQRNPRVKRWVFKFIISKGSVLLKQEEKKCSEG